MHHIRFCLPQLFHAQARFVQGHIAHRHLVATIDATDFTISRVFHSVALLTTQQLHQKAVECLRACTDDDLLGGHGHGAELVEVAGDGAAQFRCTRRGRGAQKASVALQNSAAHELGPCGKGEKLRGSRTGDEVHKPRLLLCRLYRYHPLGRGQGTVNVADEVATLFHAADVALGYQLFVGVLHGDNTHLQMLRQRPLGGQFLPCRQRSRQNIPLYIAVKLLIQAHFPALFQRVGQHITSHLVLINHTVLDI